MKRIGMFICALTILLAACAAPSAEPEAPEGTETEGRLLLAESGTALLVTEDGTPMVLSVQADGDDPWGGFHSGDWLRVAHGGVDASYPQQNGADEWERQEEGDVEEVPEETRTAQEE
ncbi:MAG: hypothetical protein K2L38_07870, partial [Dysosmobacter sp.]|nr:hypothetical protein [Dysosmobacter sp.]